MLEPSLLELALATCFSSPRLTELIKSYLMGELTLNAGRKKEFHARCVALIRKDLDSDYPRQFRLNDMDQMLQALWPENMLIGENGRRIAFMDLLFDRLFIENGDFIQYRDGHVLDYARFTARMDPALVVAWRIAHRITTWPTLQSHDLIRMVAAQQPLFAPPAVAGEAVAENHVHPNGAYYAGMVLMDQLLNVSHDQHVAVEFAGLGRLVRGMLREVKLASTPFSDDGNTGKQMKDPVVDMVECALGKRAMITPPRNLCWQWLATQNEEIKPRNPRWLRQQIARCMVNKQVDQAWLWFLIWLWVHFQNPYCTSILRMAIYYLVSSLMHIRRRLVMDGVGLGRFVGYFDERLRANRGEAYVGSSARTIFQGPDDVAELKVGRSRVDKDSITDWLGQLAKASGLPTSVYLRPTVEADRARYRHMMDRWHFCVHFYRGAQFVNSPDKVWQEVTKLRWQIKGLQNWSGPEFLLDDAKKLGRLLSPVRWVRGLDVAGDENLVKTEVFAPALRWLRAYSVSKPVRERATAGLHLSIHAGEDYAHPLSGLRQIDETVRFCEMRDGDRLGHALALGISPAQWVAAHGEIVMPVDEHVDNLVWAWHYATLMSSRLPLAAQVLPLLARRIERLVKFVPWVHGECQILGWVQRQGTARTCQSTAILGHLTPEVLFNAWKLRRNCYFKLRSYDPATAVQGDLINVILPDLAMLNARGQSTENERGYLPEVMLYRQRWRWLKQIQLGENSAGCQIIQPVRKVRIRLQTNLHHEFDIDLKYDAGQNLIEDSHSEQELEFIEALQDWLLDAYDQRGLMIETNPTSNLYTARFSQYADHPIFRWYPPQQDWLKNGERYNRFGLRRGPIKVCVNTDDPGIMPTTLRTEFALLCEAALQHGVTRTDAEAWVERLRQFGLHEFRKKHQPVWVERNRR